MDLLPTYTPCVGCVGILERILYGPQPVCILVSNFLNLHIDITHPPGQQRMAQQAHPSTPDGVGLSKAAPGTEPRTLPASLPLPDNDNYAGSNTVSQISHQLQP